MSKRNSAKYKLDRRMGENIWGRPKSPVNKREYGPGQHGQRRKGKMSDFGIQLRAKQKLKGYYGDITEKQFKKNYFEASRMKGDTGQNLIGLLTKHREFVQKGLMPVRKSFEGTDTVTQLNHSQASHLKYLEHLRARNFQQTMLREFFILVDPPADAAERIAGFLRDYPRRGP